MSTILTEVGGKSDPNLNTRLQSMLVEETENGISRCELTFENYLPSATDYLYFEQPFAFGKPIAVKIASPGASAPKTLFEGKITGIEGRFPARAMPEIVVLAEDELQSLRMVRRTRTFLDLTDEEIIKTVVGDSGLSVSSSVSGGEKHPCVVQLNQSDLAFVRERASRIGATISASGKTFYLAPRPKRGSGLVKLVYGAELLEFSVLADAASQREKVVVAGWDPETKTAVKAEADSKSISSELDGLTGGDAAAKTVVKDGCVEQIVHPLPISEQEAKALAEASYAQMARRFVTGTGLAVGNPDLRVGSQVELTELGPLFSGKYRVTETRHTFTLDTGYRTQFRVERPGTGS